MPTSFGKYAIATPVKHQLEKEPEWYWMIRPSTSRDEMSITQFVTTELRSNQGGEVGTRLPSIVEIAWRELALLFAGTNIPTSETDPTPCLKVGASIEEIEAVLAQMPYHLVKELWQALGDAVPGWGPRKAKN